MKTQLRILTAILLFAGSFYNLNAQYTVTGQVLNEYGDPLPTATCVAVSAIDSTFLKFALSDGEGRFELKDLTKKSILLQITFLGYNQYEKRFNAPESGATIDAGQVQLSRSDIKLDEIVIKGENTPIIAKKDTLVYNANAFETTPSEVVEDLLRKMPGIEVEDDGTVIAQGEEVEKVTVDGKDFFNNDPKVATKNLPAQAIDKVEFFNRPSEMSEFTGVDDGERIKTMNLELKEDHKKGQFGTVAGAYGTDDRYDSRLSINRFTPNLQLSVIGNFNNINQQGFSVDDYISFMGSMRGFRSRDAGGIPINSGLSDGFVTTNAGGVNLNYDFSPKTKLNLSYFLNDINNDITSMTTRETFLEEEVTFITNENVEQLSDNTGHSLQMRLDHKIDSTQDIRLTSNVGLNDATLSNVSSSNLNTRGSTENQSNNSYGTIGDNQSLAGTLMYRKKLGAKKNKSLTINLNLNTSDENFDADLESENIFFPDDPVRMYSEEIVQRQLQTDDVMNYQVRGSYVQPAGKGKWLEFMYRRQNFNNELARDVYDAIMGGEEFNDLLSNHYDRTFIYDRGGLALHFNGENSSATIEGQIQNSRLTGDIISEDLLIENQSTYFLPRLTLRRDMGNAHNLFMRYSTSVREPSLTQLQPILDNSNPLNLYIGNPDLITEYRHNMRLNYVKFNEFSFSSLFAFINATYVRNNIINETIIDENFVRTTRPVNVDYDFSVNGNVSYSTPVRSLGMKVRFNTNLRYQNSILFINTVKNKSNRYTSRVGLTLDNRNKETIDISVGANLSYNLTTYSVSEENNQSFLNQTYNADITYKPTDYWIFSTRLRTRVFTQESIGETQTIPLLNASISRFVTNNRKLEVKFSVFDLLNKNLGFNQRSTLNYIETEEIISLGRYFMVGFNYSIRGTEGNTSRGGGRGPGGFRR
ncbi:MAG: TonB-dependent receptor [Saprospiraceae bacterium]|nr:TonB-dependent receptor [Saprospiraceae bacterium]